MTATDDRSEEQRGPSESLLGRRDGREADRSPAAVVDASLKRPRISVVIPVYQSEKCVRELATRLRSSLSTITESYEIVFVEDGGRDASWDIVRALASDDARIIGVQFSRNFGQHFALTAGIDRARGDWVVTMDCDLQDPPEEIPRLYRKAQEGYDIVLARRTSDDGRQVNPLTSRLFYRVFNYLTGTQLDPAVGAFRIFSRRVRDEFVTMRERARFFGGLMHWMGFPTASIDVVRASRFADASSYDFRKRMAMALPAIIAFSNKPLVLAIKLGFLIAGLSIVAGLVLAARRIVYEIQIEGWTSLIVSLYFLGGVIIATLGIVGVYVGKTFDQTKERPLYIVRRTTGDE